MQTYGVTSNPIQESPELLKRNEAAELLRVSTRTFDRYVADGAVPKIALSPRAIRFRRADVEALLSEEPS